MDRPSPVPLKFVAIRELRGIRLADIARATRIRLDYLAAIEAGELNKLPAGVYARSYVRQYAQAIGCNPAELLECLAEPIEPQSARTAFRGFARASLRAREVLRHAWISRLQRST